MKSVNGKKICSKCKVKKPVADFHKNRTRPDGLNRQCKLCMKKLVDAWNEKNRDYKREYRRQAYMNAQLAQLGVKP